MHSFGEKIMKCLEVTNAISYSQTIESEFRNGYSRACSAKSKCETANNEQLPQATLSKEFLHEGP